MSKEERARKWNSNLQFWYQLDGTKESRIQPIMEKRRRKKYDLTKAVHNAWTPSLSA